MRDIARLRLFQCSGCWSYMLLKPVGDYMECDCGECLTLVDLRGKTSVLEDADLSVKATWPAEDGQCAARRYAPLESGYDPGRCCLKAGHTGPHAADFKWWYEPGESEAAFMERPEPERFCPACDLNVNACICELSEVERGDERG